MKLTAEQQAFKQIDVLSQKIRQQFLEKGVVLPSHDKEGKIRIGKFIISKNKDGLFDIVDITGFLIAGRINLAQTAILVSNKLALGKILDKTLLENDRQYGYALFEETLQKQALTRSQDIDRTCLLLNKLAKSSSKREFHQRYIFSNFEKLKKIT
jgi:hypothetical protein